MGVTAVVCCVRHRYVTGHIWACPPSEGDDYIFHCHPPDQKIPKPKRLQEWYKKMLDKAFAERIIHDYKVCYCFISDLIFIVFSFEGSCCCFITPEKWSTVVQGFILSQCLHFLRFSWDSAFQAENSLGLVSAWRAVCKNLPLCIFLSMHFLGKEIWSLSRFIEAVCFCWSWRSRWNAGPH